MRRARSRAERRAGLAGTLPLFCTQRWAGASCRTQRADMGRRTLERPARGPGAPGLGSEVREARSARCLVKLS